MKVKINGVQYTHQVLEVGKLILDMRTEDLGISFPTNATTKSAALAQGRKLLLDAGFEQGKFRFKGEPMFVKTIIGGTRQNAVSIQLIYKGKWNEIKITNTSTPS